MPPEVQTTTYESPIGQMLLAFRSDKLVSLDFFDYEDRFNTLLKKRWPKALLCKSELPTDMNGRLDAYFDGAFNAFDGLAIETAGTNFQQKVWHTLPQILSGQTWTYGQLAKQIGQPTASRAVGRTNGLNPIAIVLPCHRVVGGNGSLTGYAGGLERKEWLLNHESSR